MELMINRKKVILFLVTYIPGIIASILGVYLTYIIPRPDTLEAIVHMIMNSSDKYQLTLLVVFMAAVLSVIAVFFSILIAKDARNQNYYLNSEDFISISLKKLSIIWILSLINVGLIIYFLIYFVLLIIPMIFIGGAFL